MSGGSEAGSSIRFFFGGCGTVMGGLEDEAGGLSVESGGELESEVMAADAGRRIYESARRREEHGARSRGACVRARMEAEDEVGEQIWDEISQIPRARSWRLFYIALLSPAPLYHPAPRARQSSRKPAYVPLADADHGRTRRSVESPGSGRTKRPPGLTFPR